MFEIDLIYEEGKWLIFLRIAQSHSFRRKDGIRFGEKEARKRGFFSIFFASFFVTCWRQWHDILILFMLLTSPFFIFHFFHHFLLVESGSFFLTFFFFLLFFFLWVLSTHRVQMMAVTLLYFRLLPYLRTCRPRWRPRCVEAGRRDGVGLDHLGSEVGLRRRSLTEKKRTKIAHWGSKNRLRQAEKERKNVYWFPRVSGKHELSSVY